jgi:hypothetical protein
MNKYSLAATITLATCTVLQLGACAQSAGTPQAAASTQSNTPSNANAPLNNPAAITGVAPMLPRAQPAAAGTIVPDTITGVAPVPGDSNVLNLPNAADIINPNRESLQSPPLMGVITQQVSVTVGKQPIRRGPFSGLLVHLHNGTNSPLMFDGDRARVRIGSDQLVPAVSDATLEATVAPPPSKRHEWRVGLDNAFTLGWSSTIFEEWLERGPVLPRFGDDQLRREATLERFGLRILWPGDETQGIVFFATPDSLETGKLELPVATFPSMEIRGYLTGLR